MEFRKLFTKKPVIGMIHLAGKSEKEILTRALDEIKLYEQEGVDAVIIEDYHGQKNDVINVLKATQNQGNIIRGVNLLSDPYASFELARKYGAKFIQFDSVQSNDLETNRYETLRSEYRDIAVLGGIRFKYTTPTGRSLDEDLDFGKRQCDAIVTTGDGTGRETPLQKLRDFKNILKKFPLIVGAGVNEANVYDSLKIADGAIVGSYFKNGNTQEPIIKEQVRTLMNIVNKMRN